MNWNAAKASTWLKNYADEVAGDAYRMGGDDTLYAGAGAAYYAVLHGVGYNTEEEFKTFFLTQLGLDQECLDEALSDMMKVVGSN